LTGSEPKSQEAADRCAREQALDRVQFRKFKIVLKPGKFGDLQTDVREYWKLARTVARQNSAIVSESRRAGEPQLREVVFFDTPNAGLYGHGYTLRKRARYVRGGPGAHFELALEFRDLDVLRAAGADVRAAPQYEGVEQFKEELLLVGDPPGGMRSLFSHTCTLKEHRWELGSRFSDATRIFPGLGDLRALPTAALRPVGERAVEEVLFALGSIDFGGSAADVEMAVWREAKTGEVLTGEFSFEAHFRRYGKLELQPKRRAEQFCRLLGKETGAWVDPETTRTARIYELAGKPGPGRE